MNIPFRLMLASVTACLFWINSQSLAQEGGHLMGNSPGNCGSLGNGYGPFDYVDPANKGKRLNVVESHHFNDDVYTLRRGINAVNPYSDIDYTLRAFPNHHLALDAMARLFLKRPAEMTRTSRYSLACWFDRARRINPLDGIVPLIYGIHLFQTNELDQAEQQLKLAVSLAPGSPETHYNLGLLYARQNQWDLALEQAQTAYELGYPLPGLRKQLEERDLWPSPD